MLPPEGLLPADWSSDSDVGLPSAAVRAMVAATRRAHARHRWCHDVRDYRLLLRPQAVDAEAPELLTAARHMQAPETSAVPAASCVVALPALQDAARAIVDVR